MASRGGIAEPRAFLFLCDQSTEAECLRRQLVGSPQDSALWAMSVQPGDHIYLFNYNTRIIRGPYTVGSGADCHDPAAWQGKFPIQVKVVPNDFTRIADAKSPDAPGILQRRRPAHVLGTAAAELFSWIQESGSPL